MKIFFDGGCRPVRADTACGGMELAVVAGGRVHVSRNLGIGTSMDAEWLALIAAMRLAHDLGVANAVLLGDAAAVIAQANGVARCTAVHARHLDLFRSLPRPTGRVRVRYVKRTQNLAGIALAALHDR